MLEHKSVVSLKRVKIADKKAELLYDYNADLHGIGNRSLL